MADAPLADPLPEGRRLLIINYHFPPDGSVGGQRWAGFAKYLARAGWDVHVLTSAVQPDAQLHEGITVHVVERARTLDDLYKAIAVKRRDARLPAADLNADVTRPSTWLQRALSHIRSELAAWLGFPDYTRGWLLRASWRSRQLVRRLRPDIVITSGPPHTAHLVGILSTLGRGTPMVADLRDPWVSFAPRNHISETSQGFVRQRVLRSWERLVFRRAKAIVTNAPDFAEVLAKHHPQLPVKWLPNGIDPDRILPPSEEPYPGLSIAYVGTLYVGRDLGPVLHALSLFLERNPAAARDGSMLRIAGHMTDVHEARFRTQLEKSGVQEYVQLLGVVKSREALDLLNRSSLAIVLAQDQSLQVPAKIYESVGMGIPTLVITEPDSASAKEAARIGAIVVRPEDIESVCRVFEQIWSGHLPSRQSPLEAIDYPYLSQEMGRLLLEYISGSSAGPRFAAAESAVPLPQHAKAHASV